MPHRGAAGEDAEVGLAEHLADQTHAPHDAQVTAIGRGDAGRLLPAVLQRI